jgi:hypothetical protein
MATVLTEDVLQDDIAVSLARVIAAANKRAGELGVDVLASIITVSQLPVNNDFLWRVNYGPKNYVGQRGGDLILDVDPEKAHIQRELWGQ